MNARFLVAVLCSTSVAEAQQFVEHPLSTNVGKVSSIFATDLDGDGDNDVLLAAFPGATGFLGSLSWIENLDGPAGFGPVQSIVGDVADSSDVRAADLDGDGDADVLAVTQTLFGASGHKLVWYENLDGLGSFASEQPVGGIAKPVMAAELVDLDGDGDLDVLARSHPGTKDEIAWASNNGTGGFGPGQVIASTGDSAFALAADLDGDGDEDVIVSFVGASTSTVWFQNPGDGTFGAQQALPDSGRVLLAADLDADGDLDVVSGRPGALVWRKNEDGAGTLGPELSILSDPNTTPVSVEAADLDDDGDPDLLMSATFFGLDGQIAVLLNVDGLGTFGAPQVVANQFLVTFQARAADLDGDGDLDLAWGMTGQNASVAWRENLVCCALSADTDTLSLSTGGVQALELDAGPIKGLNLFWLQSTTTGTTPGFALQPAPLELPLNFSNLLLLTIVTPNALIPNSLGVLDASGGHALALTLPPGLDPGLAGATLHHAYVVLSFSSGTLEVAGISNAVPLTLVP